MNEPDTLARDIPSPTAADAAAFLSGILGRPVDADEYVTAALETWTGLVAARAYLAGADMAVTRMRDALSTRSQT